MVHRLEINYVVVSSCLFVGYYKELKVCQFSHTRDNGVVGN